jgi:hypothetical protein
MRSILKSDEHTFVPLVECIKHYTEILFIFFPRSSLGDIFRKMAVDLFPLHEIPDSSFMARDSHALIRAGKLDSVVNAHLGRHRGESGVFGLTSISWSVSINSSSSVWGSPISHYIWANTAASFKFDYQRNIESGSVGHCPSHEASCL